MKKSLVLAMAMALGVTASAYAANPFSDVPAGHWAYDSVAKLAAAGVVDGYADGAFDGDKLMTRYEMAQIVAKAMAKGADCDKLAAEFADELDTLGVRVAKLEKGADAVKISGQVRMRYQSHDNGGDAADLRTRLWVTGQINDNWTYTGMLQSQQDLLNDDDGLGGNKGEDDIVLNRAYLNGKIGGADVQVGRWDEVTSSGAVLDLYVDGVKASYGKDVKIWGLAAKGATGDCALDVNANTSDRVYIVGLETKVGAVDAYANYFRADGVTDKDNQTLWDQEVYNIGLGMNVAEDLRLTYEYMWGDKEYNEAVSKDGFIVGLNYKGATDEVGTYGVHAFWYDQPVNAFISPTFDLTNFAAYGGYEGWSFGVDYTVAKNVQLCVNYYDTEAKAANKDDQSIFTELYFMF